MLPQVELVAYICNFSTGQAGARLSQHFQAILGSVAKTTFVSKILLCTGDISYLNSLAIAITLNNEDRTFSFLAQGSFEQL